MGNINLTNNLNNAYKGIDNNDDMNEMNRLQQNINYDDSNEFDNIMLNQQQGGEDNKKKIPNFRYCFSSSFFTNNNYHKTSNKRF